MPTGSRWWSRSRSCSRRSRALGQSDRGPSPGSSLRCAARRQGAEDAEPGLRPCQVAGAGSAIVTGPESNIVSGDLDRLRDADLGIPGVRITTTGLMFDDLGLAFDTWEKIGSHLGVLRDLTAWAWATGWSSARPSTASASRKASRRPAGQGDAPGVPAGRAQGASGAPSTGFSWTHHQVVAAQPRTGRRRCSTSPRRTACPSRSCEGSWLVGAPCR